MEDGKKKLGLNKRIVILGAGPAGLSVAEHLIEQGLEVFVYDRGKTKDNFYSARGKPIDADFNAGGIGGSTHTWGGQLLRLNESDRNNWLKFDGVEEEFLEKIEECTDEILKRLGEMIPRCNQYYSEKSDGSFWRVTGSQILSEKNIDKIFQTTIENPKFIYTEGVSAVRFQTEEANLFLILSSGEKISLSQCYVFLALGAIENTALLMRSAPFISKLNHQELGRNLQDHPHGIVMKVNGFGGPFNAKRKLLLTPQNCDKKKIEIKFERDGFTKSAIMELHEKVYDTTILTDCKVLFNSFEIKRLSKLCSRVFLKALSSLFKREVYIEFAEVWIQYEQSRETCSRIFVDAEIKYEWSQNEDDLRFVNQFTEEIEKYLTNLGLTVFDRIRFNEVSELNDWSSEAYHPSGTIPLGSNADVGIADLAGSVHVLPNAYVVGSALFPTGGWFNPTLVIMAMSRAVAKEFIRKSL